MELEMAILRQDINYIGICIMGMILLMNVYLSLISWVAFVNVSINRFAFRFIFTQALLVIMQTAIYIYTEITGDNHMVQIRWVTFVIIEIVIFAMLIHPMKNRKVELILRGVFYFVILISAVHWYWFFDFAILAIFIYLARQSPYPIYRKWMTISMCAYSLTYIVPYFISGFTTNESFISGLIYTIVFVIAVKKMYEYENIEKILIEKIMKEME